MKRCALFVVICLIIGATYAWADAPTISFDTALGDTNSCATVSGGTSLCGPRGAFGFSVTQGPEITVTETPCIIGSPYYPGPCSEQDQYGSGGAATVTYYGGVTALANVAPGTTIVTGYTTGGSRSWYAYGDTFDSADVVVTYIDPAFLSAAIPGAVAGGWSGQYYDHIFNDAQLEGAGSTLLLTDPPPVPEPGTLVLFGTGLVVACIMLNSKRRGEA